MVHYVVSAVVVVTVMRVLLFILDVSMLRDWKGDGNAGAGEGRGVVVVSAVHEYVGHTRGSGIAFSAADVLGMSVVRGMRGVGGGCEMCMCLARSGVGGEEGEWIRGLGLGFTNPMETGGVLDVCFGCGGVGVGGLGGEWVEGLD